MAINPETRYSGKIAPSSTDYPYGAARNVTLPGDGTGTPWEAALVNDLFGFQQALLSAAGIVPSGDPDKVGASQYLQALLNVAIPEYTGFTQLQAVDTTKITKLWLWELWTGIEESGGFFKWSSTTDKATADGGVTLDPSVSLANQGTGVGTGCWVREKFTVITPGAFGAKGDGSTIDTDYIQTAIEYSSTSKVPLDFKDKTYISGKLTISNPIKIRGNKATIKRSNTDTQNSLITITASEFELSGLIFDGNKSGNVNPCHVVVTSTNLTKAMITKCEFNNAKFSSGYGGGLYLDTNTSSENINISKSSFKGNEGDGILGKDLHNVKLDRCLIANNGGGVNFNNFDQTFTQKISNVKITKCDIYNNTGQGITVGNFIENNDFINPIYGSANNEASQIEVIGCTVTDNDGYGINVSAVETHIHQNIVTGNGGTTAPNAGILCNLGNGIISDNTVNSNGYFGIDMGGASDLKITGNRISYNGAASGQGGVGIAAGGTNNCSITGNTFIDNGIASNGQAISAQPYETTGTGYGFPGELNKLLIMGNTFILGSTTRQGVRVTDNGKGASILGNNFKLASYTDPTAYANAIVAVTSRVDIKNNSFNNDDINYLATVTAGRLVKPDVLDFLYTNSVDTVTELYTSSMDSEDGKVSWITVTAGGSGYNASNTTATISGDGTGATASVIVHNGAVLFIKVNRGGSGYTSATVSISGDGTGATATAQVGLPLAPGLELDLQVHQAQTFNKAGTPQIYSGKNTDISLPAFGGFRAKSRFGRWQVLNVNA